MGVLKRKLKAEGKASGKPANPRANVVRIEDGPVASSRGKESRTPPEMVGVITALRLGGLRRWR